MKIFVALLFTFCVSSAQMEKAKPIYKIETTRDGAPLGSFTIELFPYVAPLAVAYFDSLVNIKFYDSTAFHRVVPGFVIQGGDPNSKHLPRETWGNGDPAQTNVPAEFSKVMYYRGILGAARDTDPNSANSQFFICVADAFSLNGLYTVYGKVISGMDIVDTIVSQPRDANDNPLKKIEMFVTKIGENDSVPEIPVPTSPENNAIRMTPDSLLYWSDVKDAVLYNIQIATDSLFNNIIFSDSLGSNVYRLAAVELGLKKYFWRVYSNNGGHRSAFSSSRSFTTAISLTDLLIPIKGATNQPGNVTLKWGKVFGAVSYHLQVSTNAQFNQTGLVLDKKNITDTTQQLSGLQLSKKHYWRVAAATPEYEGAFTLQSYFFTGTAAGVDEENNIPAEFMLEQNHPNPFNPTTTITYQLPMASSVTLKIFSVLGKEITVLINEEQSAGRHSVECNAEQLSSGVYFYTLSAGSFMQTKRMVVLK